MLNVPLTAAIWNSAPCRRADLHDLHDQIQSASPELKNLVYFAIKQDRKAQWRKKPAVLPDSEDELFWRRWAAEQAQNADHTETPIDPDLLLEIKIARRVPWPSLLRLANLVKHQHLAANDWHDLYSVLLTALKDTQRWFSVNNWQELDTSISPPGDDL